ncbi:type II toxin-antitoxin system HipA family toxin [Agromyces sp. MMS24-K17]|uniref:type II toxin-antitoxin system HipA family toxin n=1 Tax=Agromyces sp. MMS24-K17 TaxID=3372850 RepID=UPI0037549E6B
MPRELTVELHGERVGSLVEVRGGIDFLPDPDAVRRHGLGSQVMSLAVPLVPRPSPRDRRRRANFFAELLPEGRARPQLATLARVPDDDVLGMLAAYGRDVAGALQIWDPAVPDEPRTPAIEPVDDAAIRTMLDDVQRTPLGNAPRRGKTSLNGVQSKIVLVRTDDGWARALDGYPSTHIVKPIVADLPTMIFDEEYGSRFVRALGLARFETTLTRFVDAAALVVERYDRSPLSPDGRIHQEDFSQILGLAGDRKYETYGGRGLREAARHLDTGDRSRLAKMVTLSIAVGNLDMHAKNISVLHHPDGTFELAPMYDCVPQTFHDNDGAFAFAVNGVFEHRLITRQDLAAEFTTWGVPDAPGVITATLEQIRHVATEERPHVAAQPGLQQIVLRFTDNLLAGRAAGDDGDGMFDPAAGAAAATGGGGWARAEQPVRWPAERS